MIDPHYWIWFAALFGFGVRRGVEVLEHYPDPSILFSLSDAERRESKLFTPRELRWMAKTDLSEAEAILKRSEQLGCQIICLDHPDYPERLRNIYAPPVALYIRGRRELLNAPFAIAMVGSRKCTQYGRRIANRFSQELAAAGAVVVSGMALGIDQICHTGAIKAEGTTIGVLGCGIDQNYPQGSGPLRELMETYGAIVTEYPLGTPPSPGNFPTRNRILTGLCQGLVVVEAGIRSGSLISAGLATAEGRDVFVVPGPIDEPSSQGINRLLRQGAKPIFELEDIMEEYGYLPPPVAGEEKASIPRREAFVQQVIPPVEKPLPDFLTEEQAVLCSLLRTTSVSVDLLADQMNLPVSRLLALLTELELYGLVGATGGGYQLV